MAALDDARVERLRRKADITELLGLELYARFREEALSDHPAKRYACEAVRCIVRDRATANICTSHVIAKIPALNTNI